MLGIRNPKFFYVTNLENSSKENLTGGKIRDYVKVQLRVTSQLKARTPSIFFKLSFYYNDKSKK